VTEIRVTHIGGPTVLIEALGWRILTDPTFDPPGRTYKFGWGSKSTKLSGPAVTPDDVGSIDAVLVSHDHHGDNLDDSGRTLLAAAPTVITTKAGARRLGSGVRGLDPWEITRLEATGQPTIEVTATPCRHGPPLSRPIVGDVVGFALRWDGQRNHMAWVSGDTVLYNGVRDVADRLDVDVAILHLGELQFPITGPVRYSMTARDAVELCSALRPRVAIPVHYEGWSHFHEGRDEIEREISRAPDELRDLFRLLPRGEPIEVGEQAETQLR
jgi:L-ascorbate metabolism protein UlaG (beta-lactamase superfamily)